jgi:serine/threonine-protein kinase
MTTSDTMIGSLLDGRYQIDRLVGRGGMADVYLASDATLGRQVAVKVLGERYARDQQFVERFLREASAAARLNHPNIVQVYDRGEGHGTYYIAMEYVHGQTLKEMVTAQGPMSSDRVVEYTRQALQALRFAHRNGVVHRDVKPHNMMVDEDGRLKITDFGIARAGGDHGLTEVGSIVGTAQYLSPDQARGETVTAASDLYSVGVTMFELLTGRVPFDGDSPVNIALKHVNDPIPRPSSIDPRIPTALEAVVMRAMQKDPGLRYQTAEEMLSDLDAAARGIVPADTAQITQVVQRPAAARAYEQTAPTVLPPLERSPRRRKRWPWVLLTLILLGLLAFAVWAVTQEGSNAVPDVVGMTRTEAAAKLRDEGYKVGAITQQFSDEPAGVVVDQDPPGDSDADKGSAVDLTVSKGAKQLEVPSLIGEPLEEARRDAKQSGFDQLRITKRSDEEAEPGTVIEQNPQPGTKVDEGTTLAVVVSEGAETVEVPNVVGLSEAAAQAKLEATGLEISFDRGNDGTEKKGEVVGQAPEAGAEADDGSTVTVKIASGFNIVPSVIGKSSEDAQAAVEAAGFKVTVVESTANDPTLPAEGEITDQDPSGNSRVELGSDVTLTHTTNDTGAEPPTPGED